MLLELIQESFIIVQDISRTHRHKIRAQLVKAR